MTRPIAIFLFLLLGSTASADLSLRLESHAVVVTGATPGQEVAFYSIARAVEDYTGVIRSREEVLLADAAGTAAWSQPGPIPERSLWFAVDVKTGAVAVAAPEGFPLRRIDAPGEVVNRRDLFDAIEIPFFYAEVLLVRTGEGVWQLEASRGGGNDLKVKHGALTIDPRRLRKLKGAVSGPPTVKRGDTVIAIDPYTLKFFSVRWEK